MPSWIDGVTYRDTNRHPEAIAATERYVSLARNEPNTYDSLALAHQAAGSYKQARANYDRALEINPNFDVAVLHLGNLYFQTGQYNQAIKSYQRYIGLGASDWDKALGWGRIAWFHWSQGQFSKAAAAAAKEVRLDNNSFSMSLIIALERGDSRIVERYKQRLFEPSLYTERGLRPSSRRFHFLCGQVAIKNNQPDEAIEHFRELLRHRPMIWDIDSFEDSLANAYFESNRFGEAIAEYQRILAINPNYPMAAFHLARSYEKSGQNDKAVENYRRFLEEWRNPDVGIPEVVSARDFISAL